MSKKRKSPHRLNKADKEMAVKQIRKMFINEVDDMRNEITDRIAEYSIIAAAVAVFDTYGIKGWDLVEFCRKFLMQFECIAAGTVAVEDLRGMLAIEAQAELVSITELKNDDIPMLIGSGSFRCICWKGQRKTVSEWAKEYGLKPQTVRGRLSRGWEIEKALTAPVKGATNK